MTLEARSNVRLEPWGAEDICDPVKARKSMPPQRIRDRLRTTQAVEFPSIKAEVFEGDLRAVLIGDTIIVHDVRTSELIAIRKQLPSKFPMDRFHDICKDIFRS